jgi:hypothetical protein
MLEGHSEGLNRLVRLFDKGFDDPMHHGHFLQFQKTSGIGHVADADHGHLSVNPTTSLNMSDKIYDLV